MKILIEGRIHNGSGPNSYDAPIFADRFEIPVFHVPLGETYWYLPMKIVSLQLGQEVILRSHDGTGQYALGKVIKKERGSMKCPRMYQIG